MENCWQTTSTHKAYKTCTDLFPSTIIRCISMRLQRVITIKRFSFMEAMRL